MVQKLFLTPFGKSGNFEQEAVKSAKVTKATRALRRQVFDHERTKARKKMYEGSYEQEDAEVAKKRDEGNWQKNIGGRKISGITKTFV